MNNIRRFTILSSMLPSYWYAKHIGKHVDILMVKSPLEDSLPLATSPHNRETFGRISYGNYYVAVEDLGSINNEDYLHLLAPLDHYGGE
jgi:hypothetical protein